jgi:hypothetical protein
MHDPKFEQEVQRRMHDLEFVPSESVWAGVRQAIAPRKRRRAAAILWWLFPGMLLVAGGIVMSRHLASTGGVAAAVPAVETGKPAGGAGSGVASQGNGGEGTGGVESGAGKVGSWNEESVTGKVGSGNEEGVTGKVGNGKEESGGAQLTTGRTDAVAGGGEEGAAAGSRASMERYWPGLINGLGSRRGINAPPLEWQPVNTAVSGISRPRHPWAVGFAAGGGAASVYSGNGAALTTLSTPTTSASNTSATANARWSMALTNNSTAGSAKQNKTDVRADYSYWAGIYGEKRLSARWAVDIGLNLHYYSVRFETNGDVPPYASSSASLFAATSYTFALGSANASSGGGVQTYYNHYYFLEVPATVQWRLNHNPSLPLFWRGGAVFSYLMSSNGLYYDNSTGNDEKDNGVVRHTQASIQSGLMVGLPVKGVQIQAGPEVQYALTGMLTAGSGGGHMVYGGLRVALMR